MAKGNICPKCGSTTFHKEKSVRKCSKCGVVGWHDTPESPGPGKGEVCKVCNKNTVKVIYQDIKKIIKRCSYCKLIYIE